MGVYIKGLQAEKVEAIFKMLGLSIKDGDVIEVPEPHGRLIDADALCKVLAGNDVYYIVDNYIEDAPTVIEGSEHDK